MTKNQRILAKIGGGSLGLLLCFSIGQQASADVLVENLSTPGSDLGTVGIRPLRFGNWQGGSFKTGSSSLGYKLDSVTLLVQENFFGNLFAGLYTDNAGKPGTVITKFNVPTIIPDLNENTFTLKSPLKLPANTTYWLVSGVSRGTGSYDWGYTDTFEQVGLPGWTIGDNYASSTNQGVNWTLSPVGGDPLDYGPYEFSVNGTEILPPPTNIPEPSSVVALLGIGGLGLVSSLKKRK